MLGSQLGLDPLHLDEIGECDSYDQRLLRIIHTCSQRRELTWNWIVEILRKLSLQEYSVAGYIERQSCKKLISFNFIYHHFHHLHPQQIIIMWAASTPVMEIGIIIAKQFWPITINLQPIAIATIYPECMHVRIPVCTRMYVMPFWIQGCAIFDT